MDLTGLANACGTDKGTTTGLGHGYSLFYDLLFSPRRLEPLNFCEIGLCIGGPEVATGSVDRMTDDVPSINMWRQYFPNAMLYGVDISDFSKFDTQWFKFIRADCGDAEQLAKVVALGAPFDIVIDDGSHAAYHQQRTFLSLFPSLRTGGLYVIEDAHWQPATYENKLPPVPRTDILMGQWISTGHLQESGELPICEWQALEPDIKGIFFIDEDWLDFHRRQYNRLHDLTPDRQTLMDFAGAPIGSLRFWKYFAAHVRAMFQGPDGKDRRPRVKLIIIQKA